MWMVLTRIVKCLGTRGISPFAIVLKSDWKQIVAFSLSIKRKRLAELSCAHPASFKDRCWVKMHFKVKKRINLHTGTQQLVFKWSHIGCVVYPQSRGRLVDSIVALSDNRKCVLLIAIMEMLITHNLVSKNWPITGLQQCTPHFFLKKLFLPGFWISSVCFQHSVGRGQNTGFRIRNGKMDQTSRWWRRYC